VFVDVLVDGFTPGSQATPDDLRGWVNDHQINFDAALDPSYAAFGSFMTAAAVPFNMDVDLRTMRILTAGVGYDTNLEQSITKLLDGLDQPPPH